MQFRMIRKQAGSSWRELLALWAGCLLQETANISKPGAMAPSSGGHGFLWNYYCQLQVMQRELQDPEVFSLADGHRGSETEPMAWGCLGSSTPFSLRVGLCPDDVEFVLAWCDARNRHFAEAKANFVQSLETWPGSSCWVPGLKWGLPWREAEDEELPILSQHDFMLFTAKDFGAFRATSFHDHGSFESCLQSTEPGDETPCSLQGLNCSNAGDNDVHGQRGGWAGFVPGLVPTEPCNDIFGEDDGQRGGWAGFAPGSVPTEPNDDVSRQRGGWAGCAPGLVPTEPCNDSFGEDDGQRGGWAGFAPGSVPTEPSHDVSRQRGGWAGCAPGLVPTEPDAKCDAGREPHLILPNPVLDVGCDFLGQPLSNHTPSLAVESFELIDPGCDFLGNPLGPGCFFNKLQDFCPWKGVRVGEASHPGPGQGFGDPCLSELDKGAVVDIVVHFDGACCVAIWHGEPCVTEHFQFSSPGTYTLYGAIFEGLSHDLPVLSRGPASVIVARPALDDRTFWRLTELCAGIGGISAGMQATGGEAIFAVDMCELACATLQLNCAPVLCGDLHDREVRIQAHLAHATCSCIVGAGVPCQGYSTQGLRRGFADPRSKALLAVLQYVWHSQAYGLVLECRLLIALRL